MITQIHIENFKGIRKCDIEDLKAVNLFIGKNDSCKSTIMEAISTTLNEFDAPSVGKVISRRSNLSAGGRELWYMYRTDRSIEIQLDVGYGNLSMAIDYDHAHNVITSRLRAKAGGKNVVGPSSVYNGRDWSFSSSVKGQDFFGIFGKNQRSEIESYSHRSALIDSSSRNDLKLIETFLRDIKIQWKTREFGKYLCEIFGRGLEWEFLPHPDLAGEYRLAMLEGERYLFLNAFGDGIRFGMLIVAKSLLTNNAALFIEEIESNQHPASLKKLIHFLLDIAKKNSLQIFVTTHNTQVWRDFAYFYKSPRERTSNLQCYHVLRDNNGAVDCRKIDMSTPDQLNVDRDIFEL